MFGKPSEEPALMIDITLTFAESVSRVCTMEAPARENYYASAEKMFERALDMTAEHDLIHAARFARFALHEYSPRSGKENTHIQTCPVLRGQATTSHPANNYYVELSHWFEPYSHTLKWWFDPYDPVFVVD